MFKKGKSLGHVQKKIERNSKLKLIDVKNIFLLIKHPNKWSYPHHFKCTLSPINVYPHLD